MWLLATGPNDSEQYLWDVGDGPGTQMFEGGKKKTEKEKETMKNPENATENKTSRYSRFRT